MIRTCATAAAVLALASCIDTMDTSPKGSFDEEAVWSSKTNTDAFVNSTLAQVTGIVTGANGSSIDWEGRTPNGALVNQADSYSVDEFAFETGITTGNDYGVNRSAVLRRCNLIIERAQASTVFSDADKAQLVAMGRFMRGLVFFDQAKKMGRFLPIRQVFNTSDDEAAGRLALTADVAESYRIVVEELEAGVAGLPTTAAAGMPTADAARVILSRACLQAYAYTSDREYLNKAVTAATTVTTAHSLTTNYAGMFNETDANNAEILWARYYLSENTTMVSFNELMRSYPNCATDDNINNLSPVNLINAQGKTFECWGAQWPTQDLVDQYLVTDQDGTAKQWWEATRLTSQAAVSDGTSITTAGQIESYTQVNGSERRMPTPQDFQQTNPNHATVSRHIKLNDGVTGTDLSRLMYENRDARFYATVVYDGATWLGETVHTNMKGNLGMWGRDREDGGWYQTATNYYWRKNTVESPNPRAFRSVQVNYHYCLARVGEAYMNLAEAQLLLGQTTEAVAALNATRQTHGQLPASTATTPDEAWKDYIRERRVEMAMEGGDVYFSYLRWGKYGRKADGTQGTAGGVIDDLNRPVYKIEINSTRTEAIVTQLTLLNSASRQFTTRRYLLPLQRSFLDTRAAYGLDHQQNEGW